MDRSHTSPGQAAPDRARAGRWAHVEARHVALAAVGCATLVVVGVVDPSRTTLGAPCPLQATTGLDCPLCGATRATHQLLQGDVLAAVGFNALYVLALPVVVALVAWWLVRGATPQWARRPLALWAAGVLAMAFAVARNLPWEPLAALAS